MTFLPDISVFLQFMVAAIVLTLIPGPDMAYFISRTIAYGRLAGFISIAGCCTGIIIQVMLVACGLSALIIASPVAFTMLRIIGALYLLWLAFQAIRHHSSFVLDPIKKQQTRLKNHYLTGLGINLLNPKVLLFNMAFLPQFVQSQDPHASGKILFLGLSFIPVSLPFTALMVVMADQCAKMLKNNPRFIRMLDWAMAALFCAFAISVLLTEAH